MNAIDGRAPLSRMELMRISLYWLALSGLWAGLGFLLLQAIADHLICPAGVETSACASLPKSSLTPIIGGLRLKPEEAVGLVALVGSLVAVIVQPTAAALSDYTRSRLGRRRPWILVGTALDVVFLVALASSQTFIAVAALVVLLQFSSNLAQGPFQGYVPDLVPEEQVGTASGLFGLMSVGGQLVGVAIAAVAVALGNLPAGVIAFAVLEVATMLPAVLGVADRQVEMPQRSGTRGRGGARRVGGSLGSSELRVAAGQPVLHPHDHRHGRRDGTPVPHPLAGLHRVGVRDRDHGPAGAHRRVRGGGVRVGRRSLGPLRAKAHHLGRLPHRCDRHGRARADAGPAGAERDGHPVPARGSRRDTRGHRRGHVRRRWTGRSWWTSSRG